MSNEKVVYGIIFLTDVILFFMISLHEEINAPIFKDRIKNQNWRFIFFSDLREFYSWIKKKKIGIQSFEFLFNELKIKRVEQTTLEGIEK